MDLHSTGDEEFFTPTFLFFEKSMIWDSIKWGINTKNLSYIVYSGFLFVIKSMSDPKHFVICYLKTSTPCKESCLLVS